VELGCNNKEVAVTVKSRLMGALVCLAGVYFLVLAQNGKRLTRKLVSLE
jgi:hypothetical protein